MSFGARGPKPGDIIADKYRIECLIGRGGMGAVYGAVHLVTGKRFALKWLLSEGATASAEAARRFLREASVAGLFQHPNVVEVYDVGEVGGSFFMVMEWLTGESLEERLARVGRLSFDEVCALLIPCMRGVDDAHSAGIIHRDLKPANIFVCRATKHAPEYAKVLDFGIAKVSQDVTQVTQAGALVGTPFSMAPEQLCNGDIDRRTDVYAFGVMLYQLLSGELPFSSDSLGELVMQICRGEPHPLRAVVPGLSAEIEGVVMRALARDPAARFQNLSELVAALASVADAVQRSARSSDASAVAPSLRYSPTPQPSAAPAPLSKSSPQLSAAGPGAHDATLPDGAALDHPQLTPVPTFPPPARRAGASTRVVAVLGVALVALAGWLWWRPGAGQPLQPSAAAPAPAADGTSVAAAITSARAPAKEPDPAARDAAVSGEATTPDGTLASPANRAEAVAPPSPPTAAGATSVRGVARSKPKSAPQETQPSSQVSPPQAPIEQPPPERVVPNNPLRMKLR